MLELSDAQIGGWVGSFLFPLFRIAALLMTMPIIGTTLVPVRVRMYLALALSLVLVPTLPPMPQVDAISLQAMPLIVEQILIGAMMGFSLQLFFHVFVVAGQIISTQAGLSFASMIDPVNGASAPVMGQFFTMLVTLLFLAMNGHLVVFEILAESFVTLPVGSTLNVDDFWQLAGRLGWVLGAGILLVLPRRRRRAQPAHPGDHRAAGGQHRLRHHDPRRAFPEHLLRRYAADRGAGHDHRLAWHRGYPVPL